VAKSIHERVRAQLEKKARDEKRAEAIANERRFRAMESEDIDIQRGVEAFERDGFLPANANANVRKGFNNAMRAEYLGDIE
jgi:hypothetical protein